MTPFVMDFVHVCGKKVAKQHEKIQLKVFLFWFSWVYRGIN
jgi:hypothetical protein